MKETFESFIPTILRRALERTKDMKNYEFEFGDKIIFFSLNKNKNCLDQEKIRNLIEEFLKERGNATSDEIYDFVVQELERKKG